MARAGCVCCCWHSPVKDMNAMEYMSAQPRSRFILSSERALKKKKLNGMESEPMLTLRKKSPLPEAQRKNRTRDAASLRTASPTHCPLSYSGPIPASKSIRTRRNDRCPFVLMDLESKIFFGATCVGFMDFQPNSVCPDILAFVSVLVKLVLVGKR